MIKIENLSHTYGEGTPFRKDAVVDVNLEIEAGRFVGVIGHTGSGKSTLMMHLNGLMKPTAGRVFVDGRDIWENPKEIRRVRFLVGMVFQYPEHQLFAETVSADVAFGPKNMKLPEDDIRRRVSEALRAVGLSDDIAERSPFDLSGGQKRRAAIAGVLAMRPKVLVLDEPTAGLDPAGRETILRCVYDYHKETGATVLLVSHNMEDVARFADRVLVMNRGRVALYDEPAAVFARGDELREMGLNVPPVTEIFSRLKARGFDVPDAVFTVEQAVAVLRDRFQRGGAAEC